MMHGAAYASIVSYLPRKKLMLSFLGYFVTKNPFLVSVTIISHPSQLCITLLPFIDLGHPKGPIYKIVTSNYPKTT